MPISSHQRLEKIMEALQGRETISDFDLRILISKVCGISERTINLYIRFLQLYHLIAPEGDHWQIMEEETLE